jgi:YHS domain-containing protein
MRITTTDPISGADVKDLENSPFVLEGKGDNALKIYFENEENKNAYLDIQTEHPGEDFKTNLDNPSKMGSET